MPLSNGISTVSPARGWLYTGILMAIVLAGTILAGLVLKATGFSQKERSFRKMALPLFVGSLFNILIAVASLLIYQRVTANNISKLGFSIHLADAIYVPLILLCTSIGGVWLMVKSHDSPYKITKPALAVPIMLTATLFFAALQEEIVFRGVMSHLLSTQSIWVVGAVTTALFTVFHFFTNKLTIYNALNWIMGGIMLFLVYVWSGSIWVATLVHLSRNLVNSFILLNIPEVSIVTTKSALPEGKRTLYTLFMVASIILITYGWYMLPT